MDLGLKGKCAIVTGATRGIGRAIAEQLLGEGCKVSICARKADEVASAVAALRALGGADATVHGGVADVASREAVDAWVAASAAALGGIDVVVANVSALAGAPGEDSWRAGMEIDVLGTVRTVEAALPHLERSSAASIVAVSSTAALEAFGGPRAYNAVKAAVINYVSNLATQLAPKNIRANTVSPGTIYFDDGVWGARKRDMPAIYEAALAQNPMGRMGTPAEVANAVVFVASPAASFVTGANLVVDGGFTRRVQY
ncbi:MAG: SDR family oxidoreductase [Proteobacteria bacterium]|nr:SDR family oxidoreductase [Pseudomonadota bacterium]MBK8960279.1 SDR family oxidoreductase [Pseudomonadota bacterium]